MLFVGEVVKPSGKGRTASWEGMVGTVVRVEGTLVYVQWHSVAFIGRSVAGRVQGSNPKACPQCRTQRESGMGPNPRGKSTADGGVGRESRTPTCEGDAERAPALKVAERRPDRWSVSPSELLASSFSRTGRTEEPEHPVRAEHTVDEKGVDKQNGDEHSQVHHLRVDPERRQWLILLD